MSGHLRHACRSTALAPLIVLFLSVSCMSLDVNHPIVQFSRGQRLEDLPGRSVLLPQGLRHVVNITLTPATLKSFPGSSETLQFTNSFYRDGETGEINLFGPTLRIRSGDSYEIYLANNMTVAPGEGEGTMNEFRDPADTNLHTHGLHDSPGMLSQDVATEYLGEDNIFVTVPGKASPDDEPATLAMTGSIPDDHLPGLHWYHPHQHGSTTIQAFTANGLILVEDDESWLPAENGCEEIWGLMQEVPDVLLHLELLSFAPPSATTMKKFVSLPIAGYLHDANPQTYSQLAVPHNLYCCNETGLVAGVESLPLLGSMANTSFILVNGGYEPVITMQSGRFQRWRLVNTGYVGAIDLQFVDLATMLPTDKCELQLLAKDGVYLMEIPRAVEHIFLTPGNRGELLVRCQGNPGDKFLLSAGAEPSPFGPAFANTTDHVVVVQPLVLTIEIAAAEAPEHSSPEQRACTPLRPGYAPDLRDESLLAHNATDKIVYQDMAFTFSNVTGTCEINYEKFTFPDPAPILMPLGSVAHWDYGSLEAHPVHVHVNPFQIVDLPAEYLRENQTFTSWFEVGDYMDTLVIPSLAPANVIGLRFQPGQFAGYGVMHCHLLSHEDRGCMKVMKWECPGFSERQPKICRDYTYPVPGSYQRRRQLAK